MRSGQGSSIEIALGNVLIYDPGTVHLGQG